jgi:hypothetical protein
MNAANSYIVISAERFIVAKVATKNWGFIADLVRKLEKSKRVRAALAVER